MLIRNRKPWDVAGSRITSEKVFLNRRRFLAAAGFSGLGLSAAAGAGLAGLGLSAGPGMAATVADPSADLYPAPLNPDFADAGRRVTPEAINTTYNNFYEFGTSKRIAKAAEALKIRPWEIGISGAVETPFKIGIDDLVRKVSLEERVYRHRCVEAWSMVVPWSGFPLRKLVELARPLSSAKFVVMKTFFDKDVAPNQSGLFGTDSSYPWPYTEVVTMDEAANDLAFLVTGAYGKPVARSMGAPIRLHLPWKYGFKSVKSITSVEFVAARPKSFWETLGPSEYGFWANVNPEVPHPRWSQASERDLETGDKIETVKYNGYGEQVAGLYAGLEDSLGRKLFM